MLDKLRKMSLEDLQSEAFKIRMTHFGNELTFSVPGTVAYHDLSSSAPGGRFPAVSITGARCELACAHCRGKLLESMRAAEDPEILSRTLERLISQGALGVLVSGGANRNGGVPLDRFVAAIKAVKERAPGFKVICHTGLVRRETAQTLKEAGVDQILLDVIGDENTIREVYHLNKGVEDYEETLWMLKETGLRLAPHVIIGHHFGEIRGEWKALEIVTRVGVETIVLVVMKPLFPSKWGLTRVPTPQEVSRISAAARILNPTVPIRMGCIRPAHPFKAEMERGCIDSGLNTIAYPLQGTIEYAKEKGLETKFIEMCCSLI